MSDHDRRSAERISKQVPVVLNRDTVRMINLSEEGARLVVKSIKPLKKHMPILIETGEKEYAGLLCRPRWVKQIGANLYVVGVSFPERQDDLVLLRRMLSES